MSTQTILTGGCLCGALRYAVENARADVAYCHCRTCQRSSAAPALPWSSVDAARFSYTQGAPRVYVSSAEYQREFCGICGTPVAFRRREGAVFVDFTIVTLDDPSQLPPSYHIWRTSRLPWFETVDNLPRYDDRGPDHYE